MAISLFNRGNREKEVNHYDVRIVIPGTPAIHMGYYAENTTEAKQYAKDDFPGGKVTHVKKNNG